MAGDMSLHGPRPRKRLGQHWLRDRRVLQRIVAAAQIHPEDRLLEIGPGRGALTEHLLATPAAAVLAVEVDHQLVAGLQQRFGADERFSLLHGDALALLRQPLAGKPNKVVANIPYNITGPLLQRLMGSLVRPRQPCFQRLVLLLQKQVAGSHHRAGRQPLLWSPQRPDATPGGGADRMHRAASLFFPSPAGHLRSGGAHALRARSTPLWAGAGSPAGAAAAGGLRGAPQDAAQYLGWRLDHARPGTGGPAGWCRPETASPGSGPPSVGSLEPGAGASPSMTCLKLESPAKVNLHLALLGLRDDGFHELAMVMQAVDFCDELVLEPHHGLQLHCEGPEELANDHNNLVMQAAQLLQAAFPERQLGARLHLHKHVPLRAGLGGGSSNAAAALMGLNQLWALGLSTEELAVYGGKLGSDVPFFVAGGTQLCFGRGERLEPVDRPPGRRGVARQADGRIRAHGLGLRHLPGGVGPGLSEGGAGLLRLSPGPTPQ